MYILGISCYYHDAAAALIRDGVLIAAAEEERFSRVKHDFGYPYQAIDFCLKTAGINKNELDYVVFYEKPLLKFQRILMTMLGTFPRSSGVFRESMISWFNEKLWIKSQLLDRLSIPESKLLFVEHHLSHAASCFFCAPFEEAAILTIDGVGEWTTATMGQGSAYWGPSTGPVRETGASGPGEQNNGGNSIDLFSEIRFPHSLGLFYSTFTAFLGFRVNSGEYKVMGMAPYGKPSRVEDVNRLIDVGDDGGLTLDMDYFSFHRSASRSYSDKFVKLFGEPRVHESTFYTPTTHPLKDHPDWDESTAQTNQKYADIAASVQRVTEETILKMARYAHERTGSKRLCMAGGVALNSVANGRILRETPFEEVWIQPAAGDSGGALGAALYVYHVLLGKPRNFVMEHAFWGRAYSDAEIRSALEEEGWAYETVEDEAARVRLLVEDVLAGRVVALFQGRFEWGPRALGNRSILADPRSAEMKNIVNSRIKFREPFRPFAPVILEERTGEFYDLEDAAKHHPLRYMLMVYPTRDGQGEKLQAVTHLGTGRLQTISRSQNPFYYSAVDLFGQATGVPVLLNTSFNLRGEPIVTTPSNALSTFSKSDLDSLYIGPFVVRKGAP